MKVFLALYAAFMAKVAFSQHVLIKNVPVVAELAQPIIELVPDTTGNLYLANIQPYRQGPDPAFNATRDVYFLLYTRENQTSGQNITSSNFLNTNFNPLRPTRIIFHGWLNGPDSPIRLMLVDAFLSNKDLNVIFVDWSVGSKDTNYPLVRYRIQSVADVTVKFVKSLVSILFIRPNQVLMAGHSLGAHIAGLVAKKIPNIAYIVGLDPAGPLFYVNNSTERLDSGDATNVEVIHTSGGTFGMMEAIGKSDFYPNGGSVQPACGVDITCNHGIATNYYAESCGVNNFKAAPCASKVDYLDGSCTDKQFVMGGDPLADNLSGTYYLTTALSSPYGQG